MSRTVMKPVETHFGQLASSKHNASYISSFGDNTSTFDCLDCHAYGTVGVGLSTDVDGIVKVHNVDSETETIDVYATLINGGVTPTQATLGHSCSAASCHGGATDNVVGDQTAKKAHATANVTRGTTLGAFTDCSECHASHRGQRQDKLLVLLKDGTTDPQDGVTIVSSSAFVAPIDCVSCHRQDDQGDYVAKGHGQDGQAGIRYIGFGCTSCHNESLPHSFATGGDPVNNKLRFRIPENKTAQSAIQKAPPYNQAYSVCLTCHQQYTGKLHGNTELAGCNDCHEPHGNTTYVAGNEKMLRAFIPKVDEQGNIVTGLNTPGGSYEPVVFAGATDYYRDDGQGFCDSAECHQGRTINYKTIYPLATFLAGSAHSGANQTSGADCSGCHNHKDAEGGWESTSSCTSCHGMPPSTDSAPNYLTVFEANGPHKRHAEDYGFSCAACHLNFAQTPWHNSGGWNDSTHTFSDPSQVSYQSVYFDPALNPSADNTATGTAPKDHAASYNTATRACTDLYCHSSGITTATVNKDLSGPGVDDGYAANDTLNWNDAGWGSANLPCNGCHGGIDNDATRMATGSHALHLDVVGIGCQNCHFATVSATTTNAATQIADTATHVNGAKDLAGGGSYASKAVAFSWNRLTGNCSNISCHGGWKEVAWVGAVRGDCDNCHGSFGLSGSSAMASGVVAKHTGSLVNNAENTLYNSHRGSATGQGKGEEYCDWCHANTTAAYKSGAPNSWESPLHMNGFIDLSSTGSYQGTSGGTRGGGSFGCANNCHQGAALDYEMTDSGYPLNLTIVGQAFQCGSCHKVGAMPGAANNTGAHDAHGGDDAALVDYGTGCQPCHGTNGGLGFSTARAGTHGIGGAVDWAANLAYSGARGILTGTCTGTGTCHDTGGSNLPWSTAANNCTQCHSGAADENNFNGSDRVRSAVATGAEWTSWGHGAKPAIGASGCLVCHDLAASHDATSNLSGPNPFLLKDLDGNSGNGVTFTCSWTTGYHTAVPGPATGINLDAMVSHTAANMTANGYNPKYTWSFTLECVNCHDPHGDGANRSMIQKELYDKATFSLPAGPPPTSPTEHVNLIFTDNITGISADGASYAQGIAPFASLCQGCHEGGVGNTTLGFADNASANYAAHPGWTSQTSDNAGDCSGCHTHNSAFKPSGCDWCHGSQVSGQFWPDGSGGTPAYVDDSAGAHDLHLNLIAQTMGQSAVSEKNTDCNWCHPKPGGFRDGTGEQAHNSNSLSDNRVDVHGDGRPGAAATNFKKLDGSANSLQGSYDPVTKKCSSVDCHNDVTTPPWDVVGPIGCASCHSNVTVHIKVLRSDNPTVQPSGYYASTICTACHPGGTYQSTRHAKGGKADIATIPKPPTAWNNRNDGTGSTLNMQIQLGMASDIFLGGDNALSRGASEAQICWNCHNNSTPTVSEWGFNTKTTPAGFPVVSMATTNDGTEENENAGWLYNSLYAVKTADWTQWYWMNQYDNVIKRRVASVHSASFDPAGQSSSVAANIKGDGTIERAAPVLEGPAYIRCSYCHDVHDTMGPSGKPFVRGTWVGNPYPPELPPRAGYTHTTNVNVLYETTPRGRASARTKGGYFIDQNSDFPTRVDRTAMNSVSKVAGLCTLCHGSDVDNMDYYATSKMWRPDMVNGHSNSTLGGTRTNARDIFSGDRSGYMMGNQPYVPNLNYVSEFGDDPTYPLNAYMSYNENSGALRNSGWFGGPENTGSAGGGDFNNWYGVGTIGAMNTTEPMAHKFTCSKCHNPHAAGLPALLPQNCIDPSLGTFTIKGYGGANLIANNCHRKTTVGDGWHKLAPGQ